MLTARIRTDDRSAAHGAMLRALDNLSRLQGEDGAWAGDHGGPMFLLPMYLALCHATGRVPTERREGMIAFLTRAQHGDGSVGLHTEDARGCMFTTVLTYVGLRILRLAPEDERLVRMRRWIHGHGGPLGAASWGKFTLCLLGLYDWRGIHSVLPELWLLPREAPMHPGRLWCHARQVHLPMAWLSGRRATIPEDGLIRALREELYAGGYAFVDWSAHRDTLSPTDAYRPPTGLLDRAHRAMDAAQRVMPRSVRERALNEVFEQIRYEDEVTRFIDLGPVGKVLNTFVHYFQNPAGEHFRRAMDACEQYLRDGHDGTTMQGSSSSKLWDTALAVQSILAAPQSSNSAAMLERAYGFIRENQILEDVPAAEAHYRHPSRGGWPFSSRAQGWPTTACTSKALECALALVGRCRPVIPAELLDDAVRLLLSWQNDDGGWATYERQRGGAWLELLNPSQVFGDVMVDRSNAECTSACIQAFTAARSRVHGPLSRSVRLAIARGGRFLRSTQRPDGSFEGSRGVCFTYGTWFGVSGLLAAGAPHYDQAIMRACDFLLSRQRADGAWGEHGDACREGRYVEAPEGSAVQTAWALSTLVRARHPSAEAQASAARFLLVRQRPDGSWPREPPLGVVSRTCLVDYDNYRHVFPTWALAEWSASSR